MMKSIFPIRVRRVLKFIYFGIHTYSYDYIRFFKYSKSFDVFKTEATALSQIVAIYHVIEKGLTMPEMRLGFGKPILMDLMNVLKKYELSGFNCSNLQFLHAISVLLEYKKVHIEQNFSLDKDLIDSINSFEKKYLVTPSVQNSISSTNYFSKINGSFPEFSNSRKSIRNFTNIEVSVELIRQSVNIARNAPSACNRQPTRVHLVTNKELMERVLILQGGNRGFGHLSDKLLIITSDNSVFAGVNERNEIYTNAGMFAMNLLYSLHYNKIGTCILNWSKSASTDLALRKMISIPPSETIVMLIAIGFPTDEVKIANSPRLEVEDILTIHNL